MEHVLDNPAWNALISGNKDLAEGNERIKYFDPEVSPFVGFKDNSEASFEELYAMAPADRAIRLYLACRNGDPRAMGGTGVHQLPANGT
jgi:hypothetical protein